MRACAAGLKFGSTTALSPRLITNPDHSLLFGSTAKAILQTSSNVRSPPNQPLRVGAPIRWLREGRGPPVRSNPQALLLLLLRPGCTPKRCRGQKLQPATAALAAMMRQHPWSQVAEPRRGGGSGRGRCHRRRQSEIGHRHCRKQSETGHRGHCRYLWRRGGDAVQCHP